MPLRVALVGFSEASGGAARGLQRVFRALDDNIPTQTLTVTHRVVHTSGTSHTRADGKSSVVSGLPGGTAWVRRNVSHRRDLLRRRWPVQTSNRSIHSTAHVWTGLGRELQRGPFDIVTFGWIGSGTISIEEIGRLRKPVVWRMPDMWPFCGSEHVADSDRYVVGYEPWNRPQDEHGWDRDRHTWERKQRSWRRPHHVVAPSAWLAECASRSKLMQGWSIRVIPNPLDVQFWSPGPLPDLEALGLNLPRDCPVVLFAADGGPEPGIKGYDLLEAALGQLWHERAGSSRPPFRLVVVGGRIPDAPERTNFPVHHVGRLRDDRSMRDLYRSADVVVVPSRVESFGQVAAEAQACGKPVVAFRIGGLQDIIDEDSTGHLVEPFEVTSLARAIDGLLSDANRRSRFGENARRRAQQLLSPSRIAAQYLAYFDEITSSAPQTRSRRSSRREGGTG